MADHNVPGASGVGRVRTDMDCHQCSKNFIAELDFSINGNHVVECPRCGHEHCRVIKDGVITSERFDSKENRIDVDKRSVWKSGVLQAQTSTAAAFIRDAWLNRSDVQL
jgi:DNA-directed RNA polymerase subunit RPC12/RpoP